MRAALAAWKVGEPERDVAERVKMGEERIVLWQVSEAPVFGRHVGMRVEEGAPIEGDAPAVRPGHAEKEEQQGRLARAVRSGHEERLGADRQLERQIERPDALGDAHLKHRPPPAPCAAARGAWRRPPRP